MTTTAIVPYPVPTEHVILVCKKCTKKLNGGFGHKGSDPLRSMLRDRLKETGRRRSVRVVATGCLGLCPKRAVTVAIGTRPGELNAVPPGTTADAVLAHLLPA